MYQEKAGFLLCKGNKTSLYVTLFTDNTDVFVDVIVKVLELNLKMMPISAIFWLCELKIFETLSISKISNSQGKQNVPFTIFM
jgi:hypothetical protein